MRNSPSEYATATAMCVNFALDCVEEDLRKELVQADGASADALARVLDGLSRRRIDLVNLGPVGRA